MMLGTHSLINKRSGPITNRASLYTPAARQQSFVLDSKPLDNKSALTGVSNQKSDTSSFQFFEDLANEREKETFEKWKSYFEKNRKVCLPDHDKKEAVQQKFPFDPFESASHQLNAFCYFKDTILDETMIKLLQETSREVDVNGDSMAAPPSSTPHQMQVRVTFYTSHDPKSVLMILTNDQALQQLKDKVQELFPTAEYRLYYGDVNGPIYEFTDSEQVMSKIRITTFSRTPQLFVRLESAPVTKKASKGERESKSSASLKRIEQNQETTLKNLEKLQKEVERLSGLESKIACIQANEQKEATPVEKINRPFPPTKHSASCDACLGDIIGHRYKCLECADYDLCEKCEKKSIHYEHALVRIVHPKETSIPPYVTRNSPNNVFPSYMQSKTNACGFRDPAFIKARDHVLSQVFPKTSKTPVTRWPNEKVIPAPVSVPVSVQEQTVTAPASETAAAPTPAQEPTSAPTPPVISDKEARIFNAETCAAIFNSASVLKDTISLLSKSFIDLADGAQASMDKHIIDRATMEAGVKKMEQKVETLKRQCEEKCFGLSSPDVEKYYETGSRKASESSTGPKIKKAKKKNVYKKTAEKLNGASMTAVAEEQLKEAKRRADASTAELQRKLAELHFKPAIEEPRTEQVTVTPAEPYNSLEALMRAILLNTSTVDPPTTPAEPSEPSEPLVPTPIAASAPLLFEPIYPTVETLIVPPLPVIEPKPEVAVAPNATAPISIHSSFENISSDFESLSPSWGGYEAVEIPHQQQEQQQNPDEADDDLLEFSDVAEAPAPSTSAEQPSLPPHDAETEKTFDRLLEMGFDYNVVVAAIKSNGSSLENCLAYLLQ